MMKNIKNIEFLNIKNVLVRVDYNVPIDDNFIIQDFTRIERSQETIEFIISKGCKVLLLTHFGRPKSRYDKKFTLKNITSQISKKIKKEISFISFKEFQLNGLKSYHVAESGIFLLDNIRFFEGEKNNEKKFSEQITAGFDLFVNEAFSASHRNHASVVKMTHNIKSYPGINFYREVEAINNIKQSNGKTFAIIGGSKASTKIETLSSLVKLCTDIFIGGAMANNFLKFRKFHVSNSLIENNIDDKIDSILKKALKFNCKIHLPNDVVLDTNEEVLTTKLNPDREFKIFDLGKNSLNKIKSIAKKSDLILWNGPLGFIENDNFAKGSIEIAKELSKSSAKVVIGGGDTILALNIAKQNLNDFYFVSTAGGAFLEALEDKILPGVKALTT